MKKKRNRTSSQTLAACGIAAVMFGILPGGGGERAHGDNHCDGEESYRYRIFEIPSAHFDPETGELHHSWARGVNNLGQVVGEMDFDFDLANPSPGPRAFVWLPAPMGSVPAGTHVLGDLIQSLSMSGETQSHANAINDSGLIVGHWIDDVDNSGRAHMWDLVALEAGDIPVALCTTGFLTNSYAMDVSNGDYPLIVGTLAFCTLFPPSSCTLPGGVDAFVTAFRFDVVTEDTEMLLAPARVCDDFGQKATYANAVADVTGQSVGRLDWTYEEPNQCKLAKNGWRALAWDGNYPTYPDTDPHVLHVADMCEPDCCDFPDPGYPVAGEAHGVNSAGNIVIRRTWPASNALRSGSLRTTWRRHCRRSIRATRK